MVCLTPVEYILVCMAAMAAAAAAAALHVGAVVGQQTRYHTCEDSAK